MARREGQLALGLLEGLVGSASKQLEERREQKNRLAEILTAARARAQAEQEFPSAEEQTRRHTAQFIEQLTPLPTARGRQGPQMQALTQQRLRERLKAMQQFGAIPTPRQDVLETLMVAGLIPGLTPSPQTAGGTSGFEPTAVTVGGVRLEPLAEKKAEREATIASARETATAKAKGRVEFEEVRASIGTAIDLLKNIPAPKTQIGGFTLSQARNQLTKLGFEPDLNEFNTFSRSILGQLAKVVSREGGRLTDQDIQRVSDLLLQMPFLDETGRIRRMRTINDIVVKKGFDPLFDIQGMPTTGSVTSQRRGQQVGRFTIEVE